MIRKKITFLMNDIGFKKQIGCNFNKDKYPAKRHAMQGSLKKSLNILRRKSKEIFHQISDS